MEARSQSSLEEVVLKVVALEVTLEVILLEVGAACEVILFAKAGWQCAPASSLPSSQSLSPSHTQSGSTHCNTGEVNTENGQIEGITWSPLAQGQLCPAPLSPHLTVSPPGPIRGEY